MWKICDKNWCIDLVPRCNLLKKLGIKIKPGIKPGMGTRLLKQQIETRVGVEPRVELLLFSINLQCL